MEPIWVRVAVDVWRTVAANWPFLLLSVGAAAALNTYVGTARLSGWLRRRTPVAVAGAVVLATATPFCSCGTTAVALGMIATRAPWAPIVAFMVASPLTSPSELVLSGGLLGWPFAWLFFGGTIVLGLGAGLVTAAVQRTGWLDGQARMDRTGCGSGCAAAPASAPASETSAEVVLASAGAVGGTATLVAAPAVEPAVSRPDRWRVRALARELRIVGRRLALYFLGFTTLGYLVIEAIPTGVLQGWLGGRGIGAVLVAALLGIPAYVNTEGSLPLLASLIDGGMGQGPAMAFLVTGAGTSVGAVGGMLVIARGRVVALTVGILLGGAVALGAITDLLLR